MGKTDTVTLPHLGWQWGRWGRGAELLCRCPCSRWPSCGERGSYTSMPAMMEPQCKRNHGQCLEEGKRWDGVCVCVRVSIGLWWDVDTRCTHTHTNTHSTFIGELVYGLNLAAICSLPQWDRNTIVSHSPTRVSIPLILCLGDYSGVRCTWWERQRVRSGGWGRDMKWKREWMYGVEEKMERTKEGRTVTKRKQREGGTWGDENRVEGRRKRVNNGVVAIAIGQNQKKRLGKRAEVLL